MTAIRSIREDETDAFLELLCDVFGLDFNRAHPVFHQEPLFELARKWALFEGNEMISILTTTALEFGWGKAVGIAGVATRERHRREGYGSKLLRRVLLESARRDEGPALLFAKQTELYEAVGFEPIDRIVKGPLITAPDEPGEAMNVDDVRVIYDKWASEHPDRLIRDERRWNYWKWHYRFCSPFQDGYLCFEPGVLREALYSQPVSGLPLPTGTEWFGSTFMADQLGVEFRDGRVEFYLMGYNFPSIPQFFMTDQF